MAISPSLAIRFTKQDKQALREVATALCQGNQSETLRVLVREKLATLKGQAKIAPPEKRCPQKASMN